MSLNYNIIETFKLFPLIFRYNVFYSILFAAIIFNIILILNKDKKVTKYLVLIINLLILVLILYYYMFDIIKFKFSNPINNIYFYFFNTIVCLIVFSIKKKYKLHDYIFYTIFLINILFSLFMTHYLGNNTIIVIGNIFPMIKFGNIIYIVYYLILIIKLVRNRIFDK